MQFFWTEFLWTYKRSEFEMKSGVWYNVSANLFSNFLWKLETSSKTLSVAVGQAVKCETKVSRLHHGFRGGVIQVQSTFLCLLDQQHFYQLLKCLFFVSLMYWNHWTALSMLQCLTSSPAMQPCSTLPPSPSVSRISTLRSTATTTIFICHRWLETRRT